MPDTKHHHRPATCSRDKDALPRLTLPFPAVPPVSSQKKRRKRRKKKQQAVASLPEGPLFEILSRVPYRSLCRFKCVSKSWLALCSDPEIRKRSPQSLAGFFFNDHWDKPNFRNLSGRGHAPVNPSLSFLCGYEGIIVEKCCGGLVLCKCWETWDHDDYDLVVCNPATEKWTVLPPMNIFQRHEDLIHLFLCFGMAVPFRFMVFVPRRGFLNNVAIYSSDTGRWIKGGWDDGPVPLVTAECAECVFMNGFMHLMTRGPFIVAVNTEGEDCRKISLPEGMRTSFGNDSIGQSQGLLHAWYVDLGEDDFQLHVCVLEDYSSDKWILKHTVNLMELFHDESTSGSYEMFAIHPDRNLIFITDGEMITLSYDMDNLEVHVLCTSGEFLRGLPYIPCFAE